MAEFAQGSVIGRNGEPLKHILIVTKGNIEASFNGHVFKFGQGDMLGLSALSEGSHRLTYTAATDVSIFNYPYTDVSVLESLFREKEDISNVVVNSMSRQISMFLEYHAALKNEAVKAYDIVTKIFPLYEKIC
ncbi:MAG: cyclic nucleotide-binding domain-containing protein, partial [Clostridiales bacterium]|nr:cyclic nucleotide-binding domain-containing protein [Clostridiales bacterium]